MNSHALSLEVVGQRLQRARLLKNWTQAEFARQLRVSERVVVRMEAGENVGSQTLLRALEALGYLQDFFHVLSKDKPTSIEQHEAIVAGHLKRKRRAR